MGRMARCIAAFKDQWRIRIEGKGQLTFLELKRSQKAQNLEEKKIPRLKEGYTAMMLTGRCPELRDKSVVRELKLEGSSTRPEIVQAPSWDGQARGQK